MEEWLKPANEGTLLLVHIQPGAKVSELVGAHGGRLKIRIAAPPVDGAANKELIRFLATHLGIRKNQIQVVKGDTSRQKALLVSGVSNSNLSNLLA